MASESHGGLSRVVRRARSRVHVLIWLSLALVATACAAYTAAGRPQPPLRVSAAPGWGSAAIQWLAPTHGANRIVRYSIVPYVRAAHGRRWLRCASSSTCAAATTTAAAGLGTVSATVTGLHKGRTYRFRVAAATRAGLGRLSASSNAVAIRQKAAERPLNMFGAVRPKRGTRIRDAAGEIGIRFRANVAGTVDGMRFFKTVRDSGAHIGSLWDSRGRLLAQARFTHERRSGWQLVHFSHPVSIRPGDTYVAGYLSGSGHYPVVRARPLELSSPLPLVPLKTAAGGDGVYAAGRHVVFPRNGVRGSNVWVDVLFVLAQPAGGPPGRRLTVPIGAAMPARPVVRPPTAAGPPSGASQPVLTGDLQVGQVLSTTAGTWTGAPASYRYQWEDCDVRGTGCSLIASATSSSYRIHHADIGHSIRSVVTATNASGSGTIYSGATGLATPACTSTYTPASIGNDTYGGSALESAISSGRGGPVYCLGSGDYGSLKNGTISVYSVSPAGGVTIEPAPGAAATSVSFSISGASNVTMQNFGGSNAASDSAGLSVVGMPYGFGDNSNIAFLDNSMEATGVSIKNASANANIYVARNRFVGFGSAGEQSRLLINTTSPCPNGVTIAHNLMSGGVADGIDIDGGSCGTQITGNEISNIEQANCGQIHCDAIQDNGGGQATTITDNYIHDTTDCWGLYDGLSDYTIENNVCSSPAPDTSYWMQVGGADGFTFQHNTVTSTAGAPYYNYNGSNTNLNFSNNIWYSLPSPHPGNPVAGTFTEDYNLSPMADDAGTHNQRGRPRFVGGPSPTSWTGFAIVSSSRGYNAANDGQSMGVAASYFDIGTTQPSGTLPGTGG